MNITIKYTDFDKWNEDHKFFTEHSLDDTIKIIDGIYIITLETDIPERMAALVSKLNSLDFQNIDITVPVFYTLCRKLLEFENKKIEVEIKDE